MSTQSQIVAVYGTLKQGFNNHYMLLTSKFIGKVSIQGYLWKAAGESYPRATYDYTADKAFEVELYEVSPRTVHQMARLEIPYGYYPQIAVTEDGLKVLMWASLDGPDPDCNMIVDGVYRG